MRQHRIPSNTAAIACAAIRLRGVLRATGAKGHTWNVRLKMATNESAMLALFSIVFVFNTALRIER